MRLIIGPKHLVNEFIIFLALEGERGKGGEGKERNFPFLVLFW